MTTPSDNRQLSTVFVSSESIARNWSPSSFIQPRGAYSRNGRAGWLAARRAIQKLAKCHGSVRRTESLCAFISRSKPTEALKRERATKPCDHRVPAAFAHEAESESQLPQAMLETVSRLRVFAVVLCGDEELGDELTRTTLVRASVGITLESIDQGILPWLVSRLRTYYYEEYPSFAAEIERDEKNEKRLQEEATDDSLHWLAKLTAAEREALALIDAVDCTVSEAAKVCGCSLSRLKAQLKNRLASAEASFVCVRPE